MRTHIYRDPCVWGQAALHVGPGVGGSSSSTSGKLSLDTNSANPNREEPPQPCPHVQRGAPRAFPYPRTCAVHLGIAVFQRPPALPVGLLHLRHIEVSLPCQRAHEIDLVSLVDLQPGVGTQLSLLVQHGKRWNESSRASDPPVPKWLQKLSTVYSLPRDWLYLLSQSPPSSKPVLRETHTEHPRAGPHTLGAVSEDPAAPGTTLQDRF